MENLKLVLERIMSREDRSETILIPESWNIHGIASAPAGGGECRVNRAEFYEAGIRHILESEDCAPVREITSMNMYSMLMRTFTSWKHDRPGKIENGTILKTICLLPLLKRLGIGCIYLLPVFEASNECKKGELPSPYSIKNIMKIDPTLHDDIAGDLPVETEFKSFIEACHRLGMRVIIDFVFRTAGRDCDLIREHPECFYWIKESEEKDFSAPTVKGIGHTVPDAKSAPLLYKSDDILDYISRFTFPPGGDEWKRVTDYADANAVTILEACRRVLSIVTVPGFADVINDVQPPWTDITFFKLYDAPTPYAVQNIDTAGLPPFIAQDGVKASCFECERSARNSFLWDYIESIIPHYIEEYHIDGARIDMAHALPAELSKNMLRRIREADKDFILWSEEFSTEKSPSVRSDGYHMMTGGIWDIWDKYGSDGFNALLADCIDAQVPVMSAIETPDTPRGRIFLDGDELISAVYMSALLPNTVVSVNSGQELDELQPMNLGLKNTEQGRFVLPEDHPMYGKLCFFDSFTFDWTADSETASHIANALSIRKRFGSLLRSTEYLNVKLLEIKSPLTRILCYNKGNGFLAVFNRGKKEISVDGGELDVYVGASRLSEVFSRKASADGDSIALQRGGFAIYSITA